MKMDRFGNASSTEYCTNYRQYYNLRQKRQHINSNTPKSLLNSSTEETAECYRHKKKYGVSKFQKLLTDRRVKVLKTCQSYRSGDYQYYKQHCLKVDVNHRTTNPSIKITRPTCENNYTNNPDCIDPNIHLAAAERVQNPFACIP
jgi:hypothetical protein